MSSNLWSSARLVYRGVDADHEEFLADLNREPDSFLNAAPLIPTPRSKKLIVEFREYLQRDAMLLAAVMCIRPTAEEQKQATLADADADAAEKKDKDKKLELIPIGVLTLDGGDRRLLHHRRAEVGINVLPEYQGQGYGSEALRWAMRWAFKRANLHRLGIGHCSWNERAGQLYQRLGFKPEGRKRDYFWHDGGYHDAIELSMLEHEWRELYGNES